MITLSKLDSQVRPIIIEYGLVGVVVSQEAGALAVLEDDKEVAGHPAAEEAHGGAPDRAIIEA